MKTSMLGLLFLLAGRARGADIPAPEPTTDTARLRQHLQFLITTPQPRNYRHPAVLLTDTAFNRNRSYHQTGETLARLDVCRLALAVDALLTTVVEGTF